MIYKSAINIQELVIENSYKTSFNLKPKLVIHFHIYIWHSDADNRSSMKWPLIMKLNVQSSFMQEAVLESLELLTPKVMFIPKYLQNRDHWKFTQRNGIYYC